MKKKLNIEWPIITPDSSYNELIIYKCGECEFETEGIDLVHKHYSETRHSITGYLKRLQVTNENKGGL